MTSCKVRYYHKGAISDGLGTRQAHIPSRDRILYTVNRHHPHALSTGIGNAMIFNMHSNISRLGRLVLKSEIVIYYPLLKWRSDRCHEARTWMRKKMHAKRAKSMYLPIIEGGFISHSSIFNCSPNKLVYMSRMPVCMLMPCNAVFFSQGNLKRKNE